MLASKNLFLWRQLEISSVLLLSKVSGSTQMIETFSNTHRSQCFEPHWYDEAFLWISHDRLLSRAWPVKFHTCFDNLVSFMHSRCLKDFAWLLYRVKLPFRSSIVNKVVAGCRRCSFVY